MKAMKKSITIGNYVEQDIVPYTENQLKYWKSGIRGKRVNHSTIIQQKANEKHAQRHFVQLINGNFENDDYFVTCTYSGEAPELEEIKKDMRNYLKRLKALYKKNNIEFKYLAVIETGKRRKRPHFHAVIPKGVSAENIKMKWERGVCEVRTLYGGGDGGNGFEKLAKYLTKKRQMSSKRWWGSQNIKQPTIKRIFESVSKAAYNAIISAVICREYRELAKIAADFFGKDYSLIDCDTAANPIMQGLNIYFKLWKREAPLLE